MTDKKVYAKVLWVIILLAVADILFIISYKMHFISGLEDKMTEDTAEMITTLTLTFLLIVMILSIPTGPVKRKKRAKVVEVTPLQNSDEIYFTPAKKDNGTNAHVEVKEYRFPFEPGKEVYGETSIEIDDEREVEL